MQGRSTETATGATGNTGTAGVLIPVWRDILLDADTPVGAFARLRRGPFAFLLESAPAGSETWARYTFLGVAPRADGVAVRVETPDGPYELECDWLIAADGSRSTVRELMGLAFEGRTFEDNFLIADVRVDVPFPAERRFYFEAPFNDGRTALMHRQPDDVFRIDFQLGPEADPALERQHA